MLLNVHDKDLKIIGILDNESQDAIGYSEDKWTRDLETGSSVYEFTAFNRKLSYETVYTNPFNCLNIGNYVSFTYDGEDHVFKIMSVEKTGRETYCYCENLNLELRNEMVRAYDSGKDELTLEKHISKMELLNATNIAIGLNELSNVKKAVSFSDEETKLSRLLALFQAFGAEHKFTTKLHANGKVKEFKVDIYKKRDSDGNGGVGRFVKDKILRKGENIKSLKEKQDILEIFNMTVPKGKRKVTRVTQVIPLEKEKKPTVNSNEVIVRSNMINANGTLSIENIQTILKLCYEYRVLPSGVISQLYLESFWGNSNVARVDNNWSGMTWTGNPNRPSGVVVSQGSARPASEGGHYMHFASMADFFKDYFYLLAKQGIYNVANKTNISDYTRGLFRVGGAAYDYAAAGYDHYNSLMTGIRNGINAKNSNVLDTYDNDWKNPKVVTSTTVEQPGAPNTKKALSELGSLVGKTVGNGQCYAVSAWFSYKLNGAGLGCGLGSFSGLVGSGIRACDIGTDYNWGSFGWGVEGSGFSNKNIVAGTILNIKPNYGAPWYTGYYGHTVVVESVNGDTVTVLQQNYAGKQYVTRDNYSLSAIIPSIQTLVHPSELAKGGRVDGGNAVVKVDSVDKYVNVDLPTEVETKEETEEFYIPDSYNNKWYDDNGNVEFYISGSAIRAPQSADNFPVAFASKDNDDRWIRRDFEYEVDTVDELIEKSLEDLKKSCYPTLDYEIDGFFEASIGDTYLIEDDDFEPKLTIKARVINQEISHTQPENNKTTLANYVKLKSAVPDALTSRLQQLIDASIPYEIRVAASNGTSFKNNEGESELTVELLKSGITQEAEFFFKNGDSIIGKGAKLLVKASDFDNVLNLTIEAYVSNSLVASKPLTFTDVEDGAQGPQGPQGEQGPQGPKGDRGEDGVAGKDGVGLKSTVVTYGLSTSETVKPITWYAQVPTLTKGKYLWTKTVWTYTDNTSETGYQKTYIAKDGNDGEDGLPGKDGVGIVSTVITYASSTSGTTRPASGWTSTIPSVPDGQYLWTKTVWTYTDETTETGYSVAKMGEKGEDGRSEVRRETFYKLTNSAVLPTAPSGNRNLFKGSRDFSGTGWVNNSNGVYAEDYRDVKIFKTQDRWSGRSQYFEAKTGEEYVFSAYVKSSAKTDEVTFYLFHESKQPMAAGLVSFDSSNNQDNIDVGITDSYKRIAIKIKITKDGWIMPRLERYNRDAYLFFGGYKFEKCKTDTPYSQAPEDLCWSETTLVPTQQQRYLWKFEYVYYSDSTAEVVQPVSLSISGMDGIAGKDGVGLKSTVVTYGLSTSETTQPTSWSAQVPTLTKGKYLWTKTVWVYTDDTSEIGYQKTYIGKDGNDGNDGLPGKDGVGIESTTITYAKSTSGTTKPTSGWSSTIPNVPAGQYLWTKTVWTYTDNSSETGYSVAKMGEKGDKGDDGLPGKDGVGLRSTVVTYGLSTSETTQPTSWSAQVPTLTKGKYLWTKTVWTYTDNSSETGYQKTYIAKDGNDGADGLPGKDGVGIKTTTITYAGSTSGTTRPTSGWTSTIPSVPAGQYLWTKTVWTYTDGTSETGYSVAKMGEQGPQGPKGDRGNDGLPGKDGVGLKSTVVTYGLSTSETTQPTSWTAQVPTLTKGKYLWTKTVWTYTDNTSETGYQKTYIGKDGNDGNDGLPGKDGVGIKATTITYAGSTSGTTKPTSGWSSSIPSVPAGQYLWTKTVWTYTDGTSETGYSVAKMGERGPQGIQGIQGPKGDQGIPGEKGADGRTQYTHIAYADNATGGGFSQTDQTKAYIGMYVDFTATDSSDPARYKWSKWHGEDGAQGIPGKPGADGKTPYIHFAYADDDKGTNFSLTDKNQQYQGYYSDYTEADSPDYRKYKWVDRLANAHVGGKNLLRYTADPWNAPNDYYQFSNVTKTDEKLNGSVVYKTSAAWSSLRSNWGKQLIDRKNVKAGDEFTYSIYAKTDQSSIKVRLFARFSGQSSAEGLTGEIALTSEWKKLSVTFKVTEKMVASDTKLTWVGFEQTTNCEYGKFIYYACNMLEEGNIPSPWQPAFEDTQEQIDDKADESITQDQLNALKEQAELQQKELEAKADLDTVEKWYKEYLNYVNINNENKEKSEAALIAISERVAAITNDLGETKERWNFIDTYMDVADEGLVIGKQDGSANIKISNDRISMFSNGDEVMWISQNMLHIANGVFVQTLQIGNFRFESLDSNGEILGLRYLGG